MTFRKRSTPRMTIFPSDRTGARVMRRGLVWSGLLAATLAATAQAQGQTQAAQDDGDPATALFRRPRVMAAQNAFREYRETKPLAVSHAEFLSAGYLTGDREEALGTLLGPVSAERSISAGGRVTLQRFARIALVPPTGVTYGEGDSVLIVERREAPIGYGQLIVPTGVARVTGQDGQMAMAQIVAVYGPIRRGQMIAPLPHFENPGRLDAQAVSDGIEGHMVMARESHELRTPQQVLFIDVGREDGVRLGDVFEARGAADRPTENGVVPIDAPMATLKVIHLSDHTAAVKITTVLAPHLMPGVRVRQIAKLPN